MVFSSTVFLFLFLPIVFLANKILPEKARNPLLTITSLFFYGWGEPIYVLLMILSVAVNYLLARGMGRCFEKNISAKAWLVICVIFNIGMLFVFKYTNFFVDNINGIFNLSIPSPNIRLPIGISFFTFQAMSYVLDVYMGTSKAQKSLWNILLYISFFPQLIAGPIVKYHDIDLQIQKRTESPQMTADGLKRFTVGLAKKLIVANAMGSVADKVFALAPGQVNIAIAWLGALTYALQIYFDFSGYSDMGIGLAKMFGFDLLENFDYPYTSSSIKVFWRKWHISLSTWFKEYLYIPLGGNRKGEFRTAVNLIIVFFCTGLWHGAEWTFVVWGMMHGLFLMLERLGVIKPDKFPRPLGNVYTLLVAVTAFTIFRATTLTQGFDFIAKMFTGFTTDAAMQAFLSKTLTVNVIVIGAIGIIGSTPLFKNIYYKLRESRKLNSYVFEIGSMTATLALLMLCIMAVSSQTYNPFIYFRF